MQNTLLPARNKRAHYLLAIFFIAAYLWPVHNFPYRTFFNESFAIAGVFFGLIYLALLPGNKIRLPGALVLPIFLIMIIGLQALGGLFLYPVDGLFPILTLAGCAAALIVGATLARSENGLAKISVALAWIFVISGLVSMLCQHVQVLHLDWSPWITPLTEGGISRPFANLGQPNLLALLLCFSIISVWYLHSSRHINSLLALAFAVLLLWAIALTQSRTAWLILPLFVMFCWNQIDDARSSPKTALIGLLLAFILMVFITPIFLSHAGFIVDSIQHRAGQNSIRLNLWQQAWTFSLHHPWFGGGWSQFGTEEVQYAQLFPPGEYANHAHNILLNFATEIGWPATILIVCMAVYWFYRSCAQRWSDLQVRFLGLVLISALLHSMIEYPLWFGFFSIPFALIVGALHANRPGRDVVLPAAVSGALGLALTAGAIFLCQDVSKISGAFSIADERQVPVPLREAFPEPWLTASPQFYDYLYLREIKIDAQTAKASIPVFEKMSLRFGFTPVLESLALLYALDNEPDSAVTTLIKIQRLHDLNTVSYAIVYKDWAGLAANNPDSIGKIFERIPVPVTTAKSESK